MAFSGDSLRGGPQAMAALPPTVRPLVIEAFANAIQVVFWCGVPLAALAFVFTFALKEIPLRDVVQGPEGAEKDAHAGTATAVDGEHPAPVLLEPPGAL